MAPRPILTASELVIDLDAVVSNYRTICNDVGSDVAVAAMVKADGYGLGAVEISRALKRVGCEHFFVAQLDEGVAVRSAVGDAHVYVLNGPMPGTEAALIAHGLEPVINSLAQLDLWVQAVRHHDGPIEAPPATLHFDTGLSRLGLSQAESVKLLSNGELLDSIAISQVMTHLASGDEPTSDQSAHQLARFVPLRDRFADIVASVANSPGVYLGKPFHFDMVRAGVALYGGRASDQSPSMEPVVTLRAPIVQVRAVEAGDSVGYGATYSVPSDGRLAIVALGYADGFLRSASNRGTAFLGDTPLPIVGRVSMDLITLDVSHVPEDELWLGAPVELIGPRATLEDVAQAAGTIPHEMLVDLGARMQRTFVGGSA